MIEASKTVQVNKFNHQIMHATQQDFIAIEMPVALVYNGISHVVMMATPNALEYFAIGFSLTENIIESIDDIYGIDIEKTAKGVEVHIELSSRRFAALKEKRRNLTGRTGCGICGTEQIDEVCKVLPVLPNTLRISLTKFQNSLQSLKRVQTVGEQTGCTHAAVWLDQQGQFMAGFEDIGRHVALDKLLGYRAKQSNQQGVIVVSSRASYEMVQKAANCNVEILLAVSAATSMAVAMAQQCNLTLVGFFRGDKGVIYSGQERLVIASHL